MMCSSEPEFENNSFETDESDKFRSENELSESLRGRFSNILSYQFKPDKEEDAEDTLDNVGSVPVNNGPNQGTITHELDRVTRNNLCLCNECREKEREKLIVCVALM